MEPEAHQEVELEEAMFRAELLEEIQRRDTERLSKGNDALPPIDLNRYANKYGGSIPEMTERLKQTLIQELDSLAELSETIAGHGELKEIYEQVDHVIRDFEQVSRKESVLTVEGKLARFVLDLFDYGRPGVLAVCRGNHYCYGNVLPCVEVLGDIEGSHGLEGLPDETKLPLTIAINLATTGATDLVQQEDLHDRLRLLTPALCPRCLAEGLIDEETVAEIDEEFGVPNVFQWLLTEKIASPDEWREELRSPRRRGDTVRSLEKHVTLKNIGG